MKKPFLLSVVGKKGGGKSEVIQALLSGLKERGLRIGLIKHLAKPGIEIDQPGKDTHQYRKCGAETVILSGRNQCAVFSDVAEEKPLEELLSFFGNYDLVLLEGYLLESVMKIEVHNPELGTPLTRDMENVFAVVSDGHKVPNLVYLIGEWLKSGREIYV